jgi:hypothetical protein
MAWQIDPHWGTTGHQHNLMTVESPSNLQTAKIVANTQDMLAIMDDLHPLPSKRRLIDATKLLWLELSGVLEYRSVGVLKREMKCMAFFVFALLHYSTTPLLQRRGLWPPVLAQKLKSRNTSHRAVFS